MAVNLDKNWIKFLQQCYDGESLRKSENSALVDAISEKDLKIIEILLGSKRVEVNRADKMERLL